MNLKDKVAIVTGASSDLGNHIAELLASQGCHVVLAARSYEKLVRFSSELQQKYGIQALPVTCDLGSLDFETQAQSLINTTRTRFNRLDFLMNVAGFFPQVSFRMSSPEHILKTYRDAVTLMQDAPFYLITYARDLLIASSGTIINITSDAGLEHKVYPLQAPYHMVKAALNHGTRALDLELKDQGVRVFALAPGNIDTPLLHHAIEGNKELVSLIEEKVGSLETFYKKVLQPRDVAQKVLDMIVNRDLYRNPVVEMPSFEF